MRTVAVSGNFDPVHAGHVHLIKKARYLGNHLMVILTRDEQAIMKKGYYFMHYAERKEILESLRWVDSVVENVDEDIASCKSLEKYRPNIFARGGDNLGKDELKETEVCKRLGIEIAVGVGGIAKEQSSSQLVRNHNEEFVIDIDGTLASNNPPRKYNLHEPKVDVIKQINRLYEMGNIITIFTARGSSSGVDWRDVTEKQLSQWGVKYHHLIMGKPAGTRFIDDCNMSIEEFMRL